MRSQLTLFPEDAAREAALALDGPHAALLVQRGDELGAFTRNHARLYEARVHLYTSAGVTDGRGAFGYRSCVRPEDDDRAVEALGV